MSEWISTAERLPESDADVLFYGITQEIELGYYDKVSNVWITKYSAANIVLFSDEVTCWMEIPKPPEVNRK